MASIAAFNVVYSVRDWKFQWTLSSDNTVPICKLTQPREAFPANPTVKTCRGPFSDDDLAKQLINIPNAATGVPFYCSLSMEHLTAIWLLNWLSLSFNLKEIGERWRAKRIANTPSIVLGTLIWRNLGVRRFRAQWVSDPLSDWS